MSKYLYIYCVPSTKETTAVKSMVDNWYAAIICREFPLSEMCVPLMILTTVQRKILEGVKFGEFGERMIANQNFGKPK